MVDKLDLNSIQKTELLVSSAAKDKILIKPKRTSTRQTRQQHSDMPPHSTCLPKLAEEVRPEVQRSDQAPVFGAGRHHEKVKPQVPTFDSGHVHQTKSGSISAAAGNKLHLPGLTASICDSTGQASLTSPSSPSSAVTKSIWTPASKPTTPISANANFPPSCKIFDTASLTSPNQTSSAARISAEKVVSDFLHDKIYSRFSDRNISAINECNIPAGSLPLSQQDSQKISDIKSEINIKSMMNRFQPPADQKQATSSARKLVKGFEADRSECSREESTAKHHKALADAQADPSKHSQDKVNPTSTFMNLSLSEDTKSQCKNISSGEQTTTSTHEASWLKRKKEELVEDQSSKSGTTANLQPGTGNSVPLSGTTVNLQLGVSHSTSSTRFMQDNSQQSTCRISQQFYMNNSNKGNNNNINNNKPSLESKNPGLEKSVSSPTVNNNPGLEKSVSSPTVNNNPGLEKSVSSPTVNKTDAAKRDNSNTNVPPPNSMKTSRSFIDSSSGLNRATQNLMHLKSTTQLVPVSGDSGSAAFSSNNDMRPTTSGKNSQAQHDSVCAQSSSECNYKKAVTKGSSVSSLGPALTWSSQSTAIKASHTPAVASGVSSSVATAVQQPHCTRPSLTNTTQFASSSKLSDTPCRHNVQNAAATSNGALRFPLSHRNCDAGGQISTTNTNFSPPSFASTTSTTTSSIITASASSSWVKSPSSQVQKSHMPPTTQSTSQSTSPSTQLTSRDRPLTFVAAKSSDKFSTHDNKGIGEEKKDSAIKIPPWRANQLKKEVKVEVSDNPHTTFCPPSSSSSHSSSEVTKKGSHQGKIWEKSKTTQPGPDVDIIVQTDQICAKPSKVLHMVKNFQNCQVPS